MDCEKCKALKIELASAEKKLSSLEVEAKGVQDDLKLILHAKVAGAGLEVTTAKARLFAHELEH